MARLCYTHRLALRAAARRRPARRRLPAFDVVIDEELPWDEAGWEGMILGRPRDSPVITVAASIAGRHAIRVGDEVDLEAFRCTTRIIVQRVTPHAGGCRVEGRAIGGGWYADPPPR